MVTPVDAKTIGATDVVPAKRLRLVIEAPVLKTREPDPVTSEIIDANDAEVVFDEIAPVVRVLKKAEGVEIALSLDKII